MRIEINKLDFMHRLFCNVHNLCPGREGEKWREGDDNDDLKKGAGMDLMTVGLPFPLLSVDFKIARLPETYYAFSVIATRSPLLFEGVTDIFARKLEKTGLIYPDYPNTGGLGAIKDAKGNLLFSIVEPGLNTRDFGIGCNGASSRSFSEDFEIWARDFKHPHYGYEAVLSKYLEACYQAYEQAYQKHLLI